MKKKIRAIIKHPHERIGRIREIPNTLSALQQTVDGHIETVYLDSGLVMIVNEEGKLRGLPVSFQTQYDTIVGTAVICGQCGDEFADCPISLRTWETTLRAWGNRL